MEDVLEVYQRPYDGNEVLVCMDETSKQQVKETRVPRPAAPGLSAAYDYEYERNGVSSLFMLFAPLDGWRDARISAKIQFVIRLLSGNYPYYSLTIDSTWATLACHESQPRRLVPGAIQKVSRFCERNNIPQGILRGRKWQFTLKGVSWLFGMTVG